MCKEDNKKQVKANIIVAEDVAVMRNILVKGLRSKGYRVYEAENGKQAYELAVKHPVDLLITDVMMPVMGGIECLNLLIENDEINDMDIVMCTAKGERQNVLDAVKLGACDYIVKPFKIQVVLEKVDKILDKRQQEGRLVSVSKDEDLITSDQKNEEPVNSEEKDQQPTGAVENSPETNEENITENADNQEE